MHAFDNTLEARFLSGFNQLANPPKLKKFNNYYQMIMIDVTPWMDSFNKGTKDRITF